MLLRWRRPQWGRGDGAISFVPYLRYGVGAVVDTAHRMCTGGNAVSKPTWAVLLFLAGPCLVISRQAASEDYPVRPHGAYFVKLAKIDAQ